MTGPPAASESREDRVDVVARLLQNFSSDRSLAGNDDGIIERMNEDEFLLLLELPGVRVGLVIIVAMQDNLAAQRAQAVM